MSELAFDERYLFFQPLIYLTNEPDVYINYIDWRSKRTIMYLDQLKNTDIGYSRKLELDQFMLLC
jgi:hypothetical protein